MSSTPRCCFYKGIIFSFIFVPMRLTNHLSPTTRFPFIFLGAQRSRSHIHGRGTTLIPFYHDPTPLARYCPLWVYPLRFCFSAQISVILPKIPLFSAGSGAFSSDFPFSLFVVGGPNIIFICLMSSFNVLQLFSNIVCKAAWFFKFDYLFSRFNHF